MSTHADSKPWTVPALADAKREGRRLVMLTAYDNSFARVLDANGVDLVLIGDSLGMVVQGHDSTLPVTVDDIVYHTRAVARGLNRALLVSDLPFQSDATPERALDAAIALLQAGAEMVKLEGAGHKLEVIRFLAERDIPVCAHQPAIVHLAVAAAVVDVGTEGGDLDDLAPEHHMRQAEAAADQAAVAELLAHLLGRGVGGHVEILGVAADQQVSHGAADQIGLETGVPQAVEHAQRVRADVLARDGVLVARDGSQSGGRRNSGGSMQKGSRGGPDGLPWAVPPPILIRYAGFTKNAPFV